MSYVAALDHLNALGLELAPSPSEPRRKFDLDHMRVLAQALGDPQRQFPSVLIAGTNGKGSTASTLASILTAAGLRTAIYSSPHLSRVTERIRVSISATEPGAPRLASETWDVPPPALSEIPEDDFARLYFHVDDVARKLVSSGELPHHPSFFESLTALAFLYFAEQRVDIAVLEVGLGGRLDATNIVDPLLSVITDIALDHQEYLGNTIAEIAREKAGILRQDGTLITLPQHPEANQSIGEVAVALNVRGINAADYLPGREPSNNSVILSGARSAHSKDQIENEGVILSERSESKDLRLLSSPLIANHYDLNLSGETLHVRSPLAGEHQRRNIALAIATAIELGRQKNQQLRNKKSYNITNAAIEAGIANTRWPGRLEFLPPNLLLDVAHNPAGAWTLRAAIATLPEDQPRTLIFSCLRDKDLTEMARILFPLFDSTAGRPHDHLVLAPIDSPRASSIEDLMAAAKSLDVPSTAAYSTVESLAIARSLTPPDGLILATGSIYLVGALRELVIGR